MCMLMARSECWTVFVFFSNLMCALRSPALRLRPPPPPPPPFPSCPLSSYPPTPVLAFLAFSSRALHSTHHSSDNVLPVFSHQYLSELLQPLFRCFPRYLCHFSLVISLILSYLVFCRDFDSTLPSRHPHFRHIQLLLVLFFAALASAGFMNRRSSVIKRQSNVPLRHRHARVHRIGSTRRLYSYMIVAMSLHKTHMSLNRWSK